VKIFNSEANCKVRSW